MWVTVYLDGDYTKNKYRNVFAAYINVICFDAGATNAKCVTYLDMTEAEYKLPSAKIAKQVAQKLNKVLRGLPPFLIQGKAVATAMPSDYEKTGWRGIVRPDYHSEKLPVKVIPRFDKVYKSTTRPSPPLPASDYCGKSMKGSDGSLYTSVKNKTGACQWKKDKT